MHWKVVGRRLTADGREILRVVCLQPERTRHCGLAPRLWDVVEQLQATDCGRYVATHWIQGSFNFLQLCVVTAASRVVEFVREALLRRGLYKLQSIFVFNATISILAFPYLLSQLAQH